MNHLSSPALRLQGSLGQICQQHLQIFTLQTSSLLFANSITKRIQRAPCPSLKQEDCSKEGQEDLTFHLTLSHLRSPSLVGGRWLTFAGVWGREGLPEVAVEAQLAALAVLPFRVVLTVVTDTATAVARRQPRIHIKMTSVGVPITLACWGKAKGNRKTHQGSERYWFIEKRHKKLKTTFQNVDLTYEPVIHSNAWISTTFSSTPPNLWR